MDKIVITDSSMLKVLPLPLQQGDSSTALTLPHSALITSALAYNFFGEEDPIGKTIRFNNDFDLQITGVLGELGNTHLKADIYFTDPAFFAATSWTGNNPITYISIHPDASIPTLEQKMTETFNQYIKEATLQTLVALPMAILVADLTLPAFEMMVGRNLALNGSVWYSLSGYLLILVLMLGILSGSYPAFFLAAYRPTDVLKGQWLRKDKGKLLRHGMVVTQFTGAMVACIVMFFIYQQVQFMQNQELGFQADQVMVVDINTPETVKKLAAMKPKMLQHPGIQSIATTTTLPGKEVSDFGFEIGGEDNMQSLDVVFTEPDFAKTLGLEMAEGRFFSSDIASDSINAFVRKYNLNEPVGHPMKITAAYDKPYGTIIGVVKDFHFSSLAHSIEPVVFQSTYRYVYQPTM